jgi:hypothetical protein
VDVGVSVDTFRQHQDEFEAAGHLHVLRLSEVAIADALPVTRLLSPRTKFVHIHTPNGLIDLSQYRLRDDGIELFLGGGLTLRVPGGILARVRILEWQGLSYRAGPPELAILPKALWYYYWRQAGAEATSDDQKHLLDLRNASVLVDWEFSESLLGTSEFCWLGHRVPRFLDLAFNPFRKPDLERVKEELEKLAAREGRVR